MLTIDLLTEAVYRAQAAGTAEADTALTLMDEHGVSSYTLRQLRESLAFELCRTRDELVD